MFQTFRVNGLTGLGLQFRGFRAWFHGCWTFVYVHLSLLYFKKPRCLSRHANIVVKELPLGTRQYVASRGWGFGAWACWSFDGNTLHQPWVVTDASASKCTSLMFLVSNRVLIVYGMFKLLHFKTYSVVSTRGIHEHSNSLSSQPKSAVPA